LTGEAPVLWFVVPHLAYLPEVFPGCFSVYYCVDKYAALPGVPAAAVAEMDEKITRVADVVFVASETLLEEKCRYRQDVFLSPHGVDFDHFSRPARSSSRPERPADLPEWDGPIVGFFGLLERWIDLDLLAHIAESRPNWLLLLIGHEASPLGTLKDLPNVLAMGPRSFSELPSYASFFDVAILPYRLTEQVLHSNPIKLREYLAAGKPVVSVRFPHTESFKHVIYLADGYDQFVMGIERALREDTDKLREERLSSVASSTWEARAQEALATVAARMAEVSSDSSP
jgi:glycosyltransferase involved in cell wall biosynthesis